MKGSDEWALIVVDVQNDFCEGGSLAVAGGAALAERIAARLGTRSPYEVVVATKDWHVDPGAHFAAPGTPPDFASTWPAHCRAGTPGADLCPPLQDDHFDAVFLKGRREAAYSGFEGMTGSDGLGLAEYLRAAGIGRVEVCGIATDFCVLATVRDARREGLGVRVLLDLCAAVDPSTSGPAAVAEMRLLGADVVTGPA